MITTPRAACARSRFPALGTTAELVVTDQAGLADAEYALREELRAIERTCSRFRADSEISRLHARAGSSVIVSALLAEAIGVALCAAAATGGLVDPTVGRAVRELGYDRDFSLLGRDLPAAATRPRAAPGWCRIRFNAAHRRVNIPRGILLDLGATAKALAADHAAAKAATAGGCGALVGLGGDIAVAGAPPEGGWRVTVGDDHARK
ncbi:MAG: FAD:protein FMN transferase, partial [Sciscionella sp.]